MYLNTHYILISINMDEADKHFKLLKLFVLIHVMYTAISGVLTSRVKFQ
jgi:hypothetical protein